MGEIVFQLFGKPNRSFFVHVSIYCSDRRPIKCTYICTFKDKADPSAQIYLCELERLTNDWRLELAPHKCSQIVFTRCKKFLMQKLKLKLRNQEIHSDDH